MKVVSGFMIKGAIPALLAALVVAGCGGGSSGGVMSQMPQPANQTLATQTIKGAPGFVNGAGFTVYVFDADLASPGTSVCNGTCAQNWPPVAPPAGAALTSGFSTITRADSSKQLTYQGRPLYTFIGDGAPGQANGDGLNAFGGIWHVARPQAANPGPTMMPGPTPTPY